MTHIRGQRKRRPASNVPCINRGTCIKNYMYRLRRIIHSLRLYPAASSPRDVTMTRQGQLLFRSWACAQEPRRCRRHTFPDEEIDNAREPLCRREVHRRVATSVRSRYVGSVLNQGSGRVQIPRGSRNVKRRVFGVARYIHAPGRENLTQTAPNSRGARLH